MDNHTRVRACERDYDLHLPHEALPVGGRYHRALHVVIQRGQHSSLSNEVTHCCLTRMPRERERERALVGRLPYFYSSQCNLELALNDDISWMQRSFEDKGKGNRHAENANDTAGKRSTRHGVQRGGVTVGSDTLYDAPTPAITVAGDFTAAGVSACSTVTKTLPLIGSEMEVAYVISNGSRNVVMS